MRYIARYTVNINSIRLFQCHQCVECDQGVKQTKTKNHLRLGSAKHSVNDDQTVIWENDECNTSSYRNHWI